MNNTVSKKSLVDTMLILRRSSRVTMLNIDTAKGLNIFDKVIREQAEKVFNGLVPIEKALVEIKNSVKGL